MVRTLVKTALMYAARVLAVFVYPMSWWKKEPTILMYHSFERTNWKHGVTPENLGQQLKYLVEKRTIVPLKDIVAFAQGEKEIPSDAVAITVDDGYLDTYQELFPLAKRHQFHFTLFLTTDLARQEKLGTFDRPTWEQLREMHQSGFVSIQLHGHTHTNFPELLEVGRLNEDISLCQENLTTHLGNPATLAAYPAGFYNDEVISELQRQGIQAAVTTKMGVVKPGDDPFRLRRILVDRHTSWGLFTGRLTQGLVIYQKLARFMG